MLPEQKQVDSMVDENINPLQIPAPQNQFSSEQAQQLIWELQNKLTTSEEGRRRAEQQIEEERQRAQEKIQRAEQQIEEERQRAQEKIQRAEQQKAAMSAVLAEKEREKYLKGLRNQLRLMQLDSISVPSYAGFYSNFDGLETIKDFSWLKKESPYIVNVNIDASKLRKEEDVQNCCNILFENCQADLGFLDTHNTPYVLNTNKPDLSFVSPTKVEYEKSILGDFVIVVGELKSPNESITSPVCLGQIYFYLRALLQCSRSHVYGFISNFHQTIFIKLNEDFTVERTPVYLDVFEVGPSHVLVHYLPQFFRTAKKEMHFVLPEIFLNYKISGKIGEGRTSYVYEVTRSRKTSVLKVKKQAQVGSDLFTSEVTILGQLKNPWFTNFVPQIANTGVNFIHFTEKYVELKPEHLTKQNIFTFFQSLHQMHQLKIYHRDIRPDNLMFDTKSQSIVLLDFGYATIGKDVAPFAGTLTFAADEFLSSYKFYFFSHEVAYLPKYDVESFLKCVYFIRYSPLAISMLHKNNPTNPKEFVAKLITITHTWDTVVNQNVKFVYLLEIVRRELFCSEHISILADC